MWKPSWRWAGLGLCCLGMAPCLWDSDTLDDELRGIPDAFDLVTGRWVQHGEAYYRHRIATVEAKAAPSPADLDDLAVAWERLGDHDRAIAVMADKAKLLLAKPDPEQQYRYHANLGTFLAHRGDLAAALVELRAAVAINPAAHFGREHFQIEAIEYVVAAQQDAELWRRVDCLEYAGWSFGGAWASHGRILRGAEGGEPPPFVAAGAAKGELDFERAYRGIGGMLRFGGQKGAVLFHALADVFAAAGHLNLGWWALQRAIAAGHPAAPALRQQIARIERHWSEADAYVNDSHFVPPTLALYHEHRTLAERWVAAFQRLEAAAIARGEPVANDEVLRRLVAAADNEVPRRSMPWTLSWRQRLVGLAILVALSIAFLTWQARRQRRRAVGAAQPLASDHGFGR